MLPEDLRPVEAPPPSGTWFAPAGRADPPHLAHAVEACRNPVVDAILASVGCVVAVLNAQRQIVAVNDALMRYLGVPDASTLMGLRPGEVLHCANAPTGPDGCGTSRACANCGAAIAVVLAQATGRVHERECLVTVADGRDLSVELRARAMPLTVEGEPMTLLLLQDIRDEKRRQALEQVFFHDVRNTLMGLLGGAELLECAPPDQVPALAALVRSSARQLSEEIEGQRLLALAETGEYRPAATAATAAEVLSDVLAMIQASPVASGRNLEAACDGDGPALRTDLVLVRRVLLNMAKNALEATPPGGTVRLGVRADGPGGVLWECWNAGAMPMEVALRVFQRSFSTKGEPGRGLGTFGMRLLAERYLAGRVAFHSTLQEGTTFTLRHPRELPAAPS